MPNACAFCDLERPTSREHIWPDGFLRRGDFGLKFSARAGRTFEGDLVIKDVCRVCNNDPLSDLDQYACHLFDSNFSHFPEHGETVPFAFDYGQLTRWLLKVAYNSARSQGHEDVQLLRPYRSTIIAKGECCPVQANFSVALVGPAMLATGPGGTGRAVYPHAARSGPLVVPGVDGYQHVSTRMLMVNAYFFTILLSRSPTMPIGEVAELIGRVPGRPLALDGRMTLRTTMHAGQALAGIGAWPRGTTPPKRPGSKGRPRT